MTKPIMLKVRSGVFVNINNLMSFAIEPGLAQPFKKLKEGEDPKNPEAYTEEIVTADTISFYYPGDRGLSFRVGHEIERADWNRMKEILESLEFYARKPSTEKAPESAK